MRSSYLMKKRIWIYIHSYLNYTNIAHESTNKANLKNINYLQKQIVQSELN